MEMEFGIESKAFLQHILGSFSAFRIPLKQPKEIMLGWLAEQK